MQILLIRSISGLKAADHFAAEALSKESGSALSHQEETTRA